MSTKKRGKWILLAIGSDIPYFFRRRSIEEKILRRSAEDIFKISACNHELWSLEVGGRSRNTTFLQKTKKIIKKWKKSKIFYFSKESQNGTKMWKNIILWWTNAFWSENSVVWGSYSREGQYRVNPNKFLKRLRTFLLSSVNPLIFYLVIEKYSSNGVPKVLNFSRPILWIKFSERFKNIGFSSFFF